jgi:dTDP-4-amino-4,6-dideoxygalactose transaminase
VHLQPAYRILGYPAGSFPVAEQIAREFISLPMYPELKSEQIDFVTECVRDAVSAVAVGAA